MGKLFHPLTFISQSVSTICLTLTPNAAKSSRAFIVTVFHTDPDDPSSSDDEGMPYTRPAKFKAAHSFKGPFDFDQIKVVQDLSGEHTVGVRVCVFDPICALEEPATHMCQLYPSGLMLSATTQVNGGSAIGTDR